MAQVRSEKREEETDARRVGQGAQESGGLTVLDRMEETDNLAHQYAAAGVIPEEHLNDAIHIAVATVNEMDIIASWNFKHMVNIERIRGVNGVNLLSGYSPIDVRSPEEVWSESGK